MNESFSWRILRVGSLRECLDAWQNSALYAELPDNLKTASEIILDELGSNFLRYSGAKSKEMLVAAQYDHEHETLQLAFDDDGVPFDPTAVAEPPKGNIALLPVGGRGIHMARRCVDSWKYRYDEGRKRNVNVLQKKSLVPEECSDTIPEQSRDSGGKTGR